MVAVRRRRLVRRRRWRCPDPSHPDETHPSVTVSHDRFGIERWRCWSGRHGRTAIDAPLMRMRPVGKPSREVIEYVERCEKLLRTCAGADIRSWLLERGLDDEVLTANRVGPKSSNGLLISSSPKESQTHSSPPAPEWDSLACSAQPPPANTLPTSWQRRSAAATITAGVSSFASTRTSRVAPDLRAWLNSSKNAASVPPPDGMDITDWASASTHWTEHLLDIAAAQIDTDLTRSAHYCEMDVDFGP